MGIFEQFPTVDDATEELRGAFGVVDGGMRFVRVPVQSRCMDRTTQHGLPERESAEGGGIEATERMKRAALVQGPANRRIEEPEVERGVMTDQDGALASGFLERDVLFSTGILKKTGLRIGG